MYGDTNQRIVLAVVNECLDNYGFDDIFLTEALVALYESLLPSGEGKLKMFTEVLQARENVTAILKERGISE